MEDKMDDMEKMEMEGEMEPMMEAAAEWTNPATIEKCNNYI